VTGESRVGGLAGDNANGSVTRSYAVGSVSGSILLGGLVAVDAGTGTVVDAYWNLNATGRTTSAGGTGLTDRAMTGDAARANMSGLDFIGTWTVRPGGPPALAWQGVNAAPVAVPDSFVTAANTSLVVPAPGLLANDSDPDGDPLTASLAAGPANGTVRVAANGSFTYTPESGFVGTDTFRYRVSDDADNAARGRVEVTVTPESGAGNDSAAATNRTLRAAFPDGIPGGTTDRPPTDTDGDGVAEDMDGDGSFDFVDVVEFVFALDAGEFAALPADERRLLDHDPTDGGITFLDVIDLVFQV
jgi:hypothetical protein